MFNEKNEIYENKIKPSKALKYFDQKFIDQWNFFYSKIFEKIDLNNIVEKTNKVSKYIIENPGKNILVMGHIQSGKTSFFLSLMAKMFDSGSNICFLAAATNNFLKDQVIKRIKNTFKINIDIFESNNLNDSKILEKIYFNLKDQEKKTIIVGLKHQEHIKKINNFLKDTINIKKPFFIDDEGDQASFDNVTFKKESSIFFELKKLLLENSNLSFLSLTATPMPHYFVNNNSNLKPKKIFIIDLSNKYIGLDFYHNSINSYKKNVVEIISNDDYKKIKNLKVRPPSLEKSLLTYFIYATFLHLKNGIPSKTSYLIHTHIKNDNHSILFNWINDIKNKFINEIDLKKLNKQILNIIQKNKFINIEKENFNNLLLLIKKHILNSKIIILNQNNNKNKTKDLNNIYIGSNLVQRGVTFENLLVTYFANRNYDSNSNVDTVLQRARWFGYRDEYKFITKIFLDETSNKDFIDLQIGIKDFYQRISKEENNNNFQFDKIQYPFLYIKDAKLKATRNTVVKNQKNNINYTYQDDDAKNDNFIAIKLKNVIENKGDIVYDFKKQIKGLKYKNLQDFKDVFGINEYEEIFETLNIKHFLLKDIENIFKDFPLTLMLIDNNGKYKEYTSQNDKFQNIFQGFSKSLNGYVGDKELNRYPPLKNHILIQIHKIKNINKNINLHKIALVLPKKTQDKLFGSFILRKT